MSNQQRTNERTKTTTVFLKPFATELRRWTSSSSTLFEWNRRIASCRTLWNNERFQSKQPNLFSLSYVTTHSTNENVKTKTRNSTAVGTQSIGAGCVGAGEGVGFGVCCGGSVGAGVAFGQQIDWPATSTIDSSKRSREFRTNKPPHPCDWFSFAIQPVVSERQVQPGGALCCSLLK